MSGPFFSGYDAWKTREPDPPANDTIPAMTFDEWLDSVNDELIADGYSPIVDEDETRGLFGENWSPRDAAEHFAMCENRARERAYCSWPDIDPSPEHGLS